MKKRGELTPLLKNVIIIGSLFVAVFIVAIIIYNIASFGADEKESEALVDLNMIKNSVIIENDVLKLSINGYVGEEELRKVRFIISDGTNEKEINLDASDFDKEKSFEINLRDLGIDSSKKLSVSIRPIIKALLKEKVLKVTDRISISPKGDVEEEIIEDIEIISDVSKCEDCGGAFGSDKCSRIKCHSILEGSTKCFYENGWRRTCTICTDINCNNYKNEDDCDTDRCDSGCEWSENECVTTGCGNEVINEGEVCDDGRDNGNYGYCNSDCSGLSPYCGDGTCQSDLGETSDNCVGDCPVCAEGDTQQCGTTDVGECAYGTQTCGADKIWGGCVGEIGVSAEVCDGLDNDCDGSLMTNENLQSTGIEICGNGIDEDCDGSDAICTTYSWFTGEWGECSVPCLGGTQTREVYCQDDEGLEVDDSFCSGEGDKPESSQVGCNPQLCVDGEPCDSASDCTVDYCYIDNDGDRYVPSSGTKICRAITSLSGVDCCDSDARAYPGASSWQTTARISCGGYDFNCDGSETKSSMPWTCTSCSVTGSCSACVGFPYAGVSVSCGPRSSVSCGLTSNGQRCWVTYALDYNTFCDERDDFSPIESVNVCYVGGVNGVKSVSLKNDNVVQACK